MKIAVVTGASSGMGREFVHQLEYFYKDLDEIWVIARRQEQLEMLRKEVDVPLGSSQEIYRREKYTGNFIQNFIGGVRM